MKKSMKKNATWFFVAGLLGLGAAQILDHYLEVSDVILGLTYGVGIGLLLTSVMARTAQS